MCRLLLGRALEVLAAACMEDLFAGIRVPGMTAQILSPFS